MIECPLCMCFSNFLNPKITGFLVLSRNPTKFYKNELKTTKSKFALAIKGTPHPPPPEQNVLQKGTLKSK